VLQQTIGEAAGGSADIETDLARDVDVPVFERALQFEAAPADVLQIFAEQPDRASSATCAPALSSF
jgi:Mg-chelatase subunit ChlI